MKNFEFYAPTEVVFGKETENEVGRLSKEYGATKVLLVYGGGSVVKSGLLGRIEKSLDEVGIAHISIGGVKPNPRLSLVRAGVEKAVTFGADFVVAVGGGSAIDTAKAIVDTAGNPEADVWDIWTGKTEIVNPLSLGVVLTIAAAGSEMSSSAVITNEALGVKKGLDAKSHRPKFAIMNPELTYTLPKYQIANGVVDILMHTLERYFVKTTGNYLSDEIAEGLFRVVTKFGKVAYENPTDYDAMSEIMWASSISHNDLTGLGQQKNFTIHAMGHEFSAKFDVTHGASLSAIWSTWARFVYQEDVKKFARYAKNVWGITEADANKAALAGIDATEELFRSLDSPVSIGELEIGVLSDEKLEELARSATGNGTRVLGALKPLDFDGVLEVYKLANH
jgi:alcohol dehydrogenase YqhD (iron-dependent ADH family)